ncbi:MAG TPA: methylated-DNA--[protein]-cysteine S-methyltransferase [Mycobacteriales bacterium]|jgi:methylated-DNA-[protein]-cysteine S-methyltransferase|nr:methylated-DNA--[protein]-cysteine S-methyltransferase [Mycobacteriales bacterium]
MTLDATTLITPTGSLAILARDGVVVAAGFATIEEMAARVDDGTPRRRRDLGPVTRALSAYFDGDLAAMDDVAVDQPGGDFFQAAWKVMREVPAGETITYTELAERVGRPRAVRAAGSACARNRIAPIIPCHRILRADGNVGGYYYGLTAKSWLLDHERQHAKE